MYFDLFVYLFAFVIEMQLMEAGVNGVYGRSGLDAERAGKSVDFVDVNVTAQSRTPVKAAGTVAVRTARRRSENAKNK